MGDNLINNGILKQSFPENFDDSTVSRPRDWLKITIKSKQVKFCGLFTNSENVVKLQHVYCVNWDTLIS